MVDSVAEEEEEEETAAGWRSPEKKETGPNQRHVTNALNSESVPLLLLQEMSDGNTYLVCTGSRHHD